MSPFLSGLAVLVTMVFTTSGSIGDSEIPSVFLLLILPMLSAYFSCSCIHGRKHHFLFSWGSFGAVIGFFVGFFASGPFQFLFWSSVKGLIASTTFHTVLFSFLLHHWAKKVDARDHTLHYRTVEVIIVDRWSNGVPWSHVMIHDKQKTVLAHGQADITGRFRALLTLPGVVFRLSEHYLPLVVTATDGSGPWHSIAVPDSIVHSNVQITVCTQTD